MRALPLFHRIAGQPVIVVGTGPAAEAKRRLVERAGGIVADEGDQAARLAFVALDEPEYTVGALRNRGVLVNTVDRPDLCDFTVPSVLDRDPLLVAVGSDGVSAGLAKHVRLRLEGLLPAGLGKLANALHALRPALRERWRDPGARRRALDDALSAGGPLDPLSEAPDTRVAGWMAGAPEPAPRRATILLGSDDPDDLTLRQARLLGAADVVVFDARVADAILARARADAVRVPGPAVDPLPSGLVIELRRV